ncbi:relaxase domain-containing protein [Corynebacterium sp. 3HC-13]|uniref:MobF family relaxase n=1 Tax=Corynebacterium poyangense TaxID=2684405 RepID=UPI001CCCA175|nr:MobF family relaxase [Corynebacterium poyangense]MBZ8176205.1 relaxase domain-containing protein [Corynebacterium poyangense]
MAGKIIIMMSLRKVNSGSGYEYLLRSVAHNDEDQRPTKLHDYYAAKGTPPGRWLGPGVACFGDDIQPGDVVTELQMAALYGEGIHPHADKMQAEGAGYEDLKIGRAFPNYTNNDPLLRALVKAERDFRITHDRMPSQQERSDIALEIAAPFYHEEHGVEPESGRELLHWVNEKKQHVRQGVAGFDLTFSPVKSVSVLWALADKDTASAIMRCHHEAVKEALRWANDHAIYTRRGARSVEQIKTLGLIATEFTHFDTRAGDPDLHSHVVIANKVKGVDGKWRSIDSKTLHKHHQAIGFRYNAILADLLTRNLGLRFTPVDRGNTKEPVYELAGIPAEVMEFFTKRRSLARPIYERLVKDYVRTHGCSPSTRIHNQLWQKAILDTRDGKKPAQSLNELRTQWVQDLAHTLGEESDDLIKKTLNNPFTHDDHRPVFDPDSSEDQVEKLAAVVIDTVTRRRPTFNYSHIQTALAGKLTGYQFTGPVTRDQAFNDVFSFIEKNYLIPLSANDDGLNLPSAMRRADGKPLDYRADSEVFTTRDVLDAEEKTIAAVQELTPHIALNKDVDHALAEHHKKEGWELNHGQVAMVRHLVGVGTLCSTAVGPAGTGKTTSMKLVVDVWKKKGNKVIALAPSAAAANVLSGDIGCEANTIDSLTWAWTQYGETSDKIQAISPGDMILIDEAGMASTTNLGTIIDIATHRGAIVRLVGDHKQLDAVETGGLFRTLTRVGTSVELDQVMRFKRTDHTPDHEHNAASLALRDGKKEAFTYYQHHGRIHDGTRESMLEAVAKAYITDTLAGRNSLMIAPTNHDVDQLNQIIRDWKISRGDITHPHHAVTSSRGEDIAVGDVILTRLNTRFTQDHDQVTGKVINGDLFTVITTHADGSVTGRHQGTKKTQHIPAWYVKNHTHLGYASTIHRSQGATVDTAHAMIDTSTNRRGLYVAMTRGKYSNHAYMVTDQPLDETAENAHYHHQGDTKAPTAKDVFTRCLANDPTLKTVTETLWGLDNPDTVENKTRTEQLYSYGCEVLKTQFIDQHLDHWISDLPKPYTDYIEHNPYMKAQIMMCWKDVLSFGIDPRTLIKTTALMYTDSPNVQHDLIIPLKTTLEQIKTHGHGRQVPPVTDGADLELAAWLQNHSPTPTAASTHPEIVSLTSDEIIAKLNSDLTSTEKKQYWDDGHDLLVDEFIREYLPRYINRLPHEVHKKVIGTTSGIAPIATMWKKLVHQGVDPRNIMGAACKDLDQADYPRALICHRLRTHLPLSSAKTTQVFLPLPPNYPMSNRELKDVLTAVKNDLQHSAHHEHQPAPIVITRQHDLDTTMYKTNTVTIPANRVANPQDQHDDGFTIPQYEMYSTIRKNLKALRGQPGSVLKQFAASQGWDGDKDFQMYKTTLKAVGITYREYSPEFEEAMRTTSQYGLNGPFSSTPTPRKNPSSSTTPEQNYPTYDNHRNQGRTM